MGWDYDGTREYVELYWSFSGRGFGVELVKTTLPPEVAPRC